MRNICQRLAKLEQLIPAVTDPEAKWGSLAIARNLLLNAAAKEGTETLDRIKEEIEEGGPSGLLVDVIRAELLANGFMPEGTESLAETTARALGISSPELRICLEQGQIGKALMRRFHGVAC